MNLGVAAFKLQVVSVSSGVSSTDAELGAEGLRALGLEVSGVDAQFPCAISLALDLGANTVFVKLAGCGMLQHDPTLLESQL